MGGVGEPWRALGTGRLGSGRGRLVPEDSRCVGAFVRVQRACPRSCSLGWRASSVLWERGREIEIESGLEDWCGCASSVPATSVVWGTLGRHRADEEEDVAGSLRGDSQISSFSSAVGTSHASLGLSWSRQAPARLAEAFCGARLMTEGDLSCIIPITDVRGPVRHGPSYCVRPRPVPVGAGHAPPATPFFAFAVARASSSFQSPRGARTVRWNAAASD